MESAQPPVSVQLVANRAHIAAKKSSLGDLQRQGPAELGQPVFGHGYQDTDSTEIEKPPKWL